MTFWNSFAQGFSLGVIGNMFGGWNPYGSCGMFLPYHSQMFMTPTIYSSFSFGGFSKFNKFDNSSIFTSQFNAQSYCSNLANFNCSNSFNTKLNQPISFNSFNVNSSGFLPNFASVSKSKGNDSSSLKKAKLTNNSINDKYFDKMLEHILSMEGGYVNDPADSGGETNKGVTKATYDGYRKEKGLPTRSVREITDEEIKEIYYKFFTESGADKIDDPKMALMVFDTAVGSGCAKAKELFKKSEGSLERYEKLRREWYDDIVRRRPKDKKFIKGWNNRVTYTMNFAKANFSEASTYA